MQREAREREREGGRANQGEARKIPEIPQSSAGNRTNLSSRLGSASVAAWLFSPDSPLESRRDERARPDFGRSSGRPET